MAERMDGRALAERIRSELRRRVEAGKPARPGLLMIRVGEDSASRSYVRGKDKGAQEVGIESRVEVLPETATEDHLLGRLSEANRDSRVDGILVQLPLPPSIRAEAVAEAIDPAKDVDGLHPWNQGRLALGRPSIVPCTPLGILALLHAHRVPVAGARVCVLGRSGIVGRPLALLLGLKAAWADATVTSAHSRSRDLAALTREADIVVAAIGRARFVTAEMIRPGAAVIDVGIHREPDPERPGAHRLCGDVDAASVEPRAGWLSPVPGGVGPLTVSMLLANTVEAWERRRGQTVEPAWHRAAGLTPPESDSGR